MLEVPYDILTLHQQAIMRKFNISCHSLEHYQDPPRDRPLLSSDEPTTFAWRGELGDVDRDLGRTDANADTVDESANNEHSDILGSTDENRSHAPLRSAMNGEWLGGYVPDDRAKHDRFPPSQDVAQKARGQSTNIRTSWHRSCNPSLYTFSMTG